MQFQKISISAKAKCYFSYSSLCKLSPYQYSFSNNQSFECVFPVICWVWNDPTVWWRVFLLPWHLENDKKFTKRQVQLEKQVNLLPFGETWKGVLQNDSTFQRVKKVWKFIP